MTDQPSSPDLDDVAVESMRAKFAAPAPRGFGNATLHLDIDETEHQRRQQAGIGTIIGNGFGGLNILMALPAGLPVPLDVLDDKQRAYVRRAPAAICTTSGGQVTRHAIRPCRVTLATVRYATTYQSARDAAAKFAPFCARRVVVQRLPKHPVDLAEDLVEFGFWGIGVTLEHPDGAEETLVEPRPWRPMRHTPAGWWFAETAYQQYLDAADTPKET